MKVSALVSAYYAEKYMPARLDNLTEQGVEIVVICQRGSVEEKIAHDYPCVIVTTPDIPTLYKAWNLGIAAASGEYLTSANTDDLFYPGGVAAMVEHLDAHGCALVCGDNDLKTGDGKNIAHWHRRSNAPVSKSWNRVGAMPMWRRCLHDKYGLFDETMLVSGDYDYWLRLAVGGETICHIDTITGVYWRRANSIEHRHNREMRDESKMIRERYKK